MRQQFLKLQSALSTFSLDFPELFSNFQRMIKKILFKAIHKKPKRGVLN